MDAGKLKWCFLQNKGIKFIEPNENLAREYIETSEETLIVLQDIKSKSKVWLATTKYYCEYFIFYALLMRIGIKCEIHDCSIELSKLFEEENMIPKGFSKILEKDKGLRIDNQYYLKNKKVDLNIDELREFILKIKDKVNTIKNDEINQIRDKLKRIS